MARRREFGDSWWGEQWVDVLQSFGWANRLQRGRSYARAGRVTEILVGAGRVDAKVKGSRPRPYRVTMRIETLTDATWKKVIKVMAGRADFAARLLAGEMPADIEQVFVTAGCHLFPTSSRELRAECSCPDWANPCKHIAAVHYVLAREFDRDPFLLFELRGRSREALLEALRERWTGGAAAAAGAASGAMSAAAGPVADHSVSTVGTAGGDGQGNWSLTAAELQHYWDGGDASAWQDSLLPDAPGARPEALLKQLSPPPFAGKESKEYLAVLREYYRAVALRARRRAVYVSRRDRGPTTGNGMSRYITFEEMYHSKSRFLQKYIDSQLVQRRNAFISEVVFRAWRMLGSRNVSFDQIRWRFEARFTDHERRLIAAEKERRAGLRKQERQVQSEGYYQEQREKEKLTRLRALEVMLMREMGFTIKQIAQEMQITAWRVKQSMEKGRKARLNREVGYLCLVLEQLAGMNNHQR